MNQAVRTIILAAATLTAFAAPALADALTCAVTAPAIRLRQSPSMTAPTLAILKKDVQVIAQSKCSGGWVKVSVEDGRFIGYVGGWAISDPGAFKVATAEVATAAVATAAVAVAGATTAGATTPVAGQLEIPSNEQLAIQFTQLRLNVLGLGRDVAKMKKDIKGIKVMVARNNRLNKPVRQAALIPAKAAQTQVSKAR